MPSKNMLRKGKRRQSIKAEYRIARDNANNTADAELAASVAKTFGEAAAPAPIPNTAVPDYPRRGVQRKRKVNKPALPPEPPSAIDLDEDDDLAPPPPTAAGSNARRAWTAEPEARGMRLDLYLAHSMPEISRARAQLLIDHGQVRVNGVDPKSKYKLHGNEAIVVEGEPQPAPLRATPEDIPLNIVFEDAHMAVIDKPAGMMVHAGSGLTDQTRSTGTLVNALLHHFGGQLSELGGPLRPGIVHRLDKQTSGLIMVAKNDRAHRALADMFAERSLEKRYLALVHRNILSERGTIDLPIARDRVRRTRMTTRVANIYMTTASHGTPGHRHPNEPEPSTKRKPHDPRPARSHYTVLERLHTTAGDFTLVDVRIETGRTHQIRVHMQSLGHPVVGDTLYGAPARIAGLAPVNAADPAAKDAPALPRNFLHAAHLRLNHPINGKALDLEAPLPAELESLLDRLRALAIPAPPKRTPQQDW